MDEVFADEIAVVRAFRMGSGTLPVVMSGVKRSLACHSTFIAAGAEGRTDYSVPSSHSISDT